MYEHANAYRLGRAAHRVCEVIEGGMTDEHAARMLNAWWPDCAPVLGRPWTAGDAYLLWRSTSIAAAYGRDYDVWDHGDMTSLGQYVREYRAQHADLHPDPSEAAADIERMRRRTAESIRQLRASA